MRAFKKIIISLAFGTLFSSCTSLLYTSLDVLRPAKVAFDINANNLLIVNNTVKQPIDYGHKTQLLNEKQKSVLIATDSLAIFCLGSLTEEMEAKDFFPSVKLIPNSINESVGFESITYIDEDKVKKLCLENNSNVILSLNKIKVNDDLNEYYINETSTYLSALELKFETNWSIHYLNNSKPSSIQFKDTVYWESESYIRRKAMADLPKRADALVDGALSVGQKSISRFVPYWEKVDRYFFYSSKKLMKQGMDSVYVKNWNPAIELWKQALNKTKSERLKAYAANNIAIAYEILGDVDKALEFATISYYSFGQLSLVDYDSYIRISEYVTELAQRKKEMKILKKQLGN
ncbi:MAG: hypothetical protein GZ091_12500 [Paludibacter sp.]|nr:hypothetical protein [Paludibacter sp.]